MHEKSNAISLLKLLEGGDRRSVGDADRVAELARGDAAAIAELVHGLGVDDAVVRMRAADALEKATREEMAMLVPHKAAILRVLDSSDQAEVRWQLVQCLPRLPFAPAELPGIVERLERCFENQDSRILRVNCLQALYELSTRSPEATAVARNLIARGLKDPAASVRARARKLEERFTDTGETATP